MILIVAWSLENPSGWCIFDLATQKVVQGPYDTPEEAEQAIKIRAFRLAQGWAP